MKEETNTRCFQFKDPPDENLWQEAINGEINSITFNKTWHSVNLLPDCKWILKRKLKLDGLVEKYKVRLVVEGFR